MADVNATSYDDEDADDVTVWFQLVSWTFVGSSIALLGLVFNALSVVVVVQPQMMSSTSVYLTALAVFDSFVLASLVLFMSLPVIYEATGRMEWYYRLYACVHPVAYPLALASQTGSIYTTLALTIERYVAVCRPLSAAKVCTISRAKKAVCLVAIFSVLFNVPRLFEYRLIEVWDESTNSSVTTYAYTSLGASASFRYAYFIGCHVNVMMILPFVALSVLNALLVRAIRNANLDPIHQRPLSMGQRREQTLTRMLVAEVAAFLVFQLLSIVDNILMAVLAEETIRSPVFVRFSCVSGVLVIVNSASNFGLYCLFGKKFRQALAHLFYSRCFPWSRHWGAGRSTSNRLTSRTNVLYNTKAGVEPRSKALRVTLSTASTLVGHRGRNLQQSARTTYSRAESSLSGGGDEAPVTTPSGRHTLRELGYEVTRTCQQKTAEHDHVNHADL